MDNGIVGRTKGITHSFGGDGISSVSLPAVQQYQPKLNLWQRIAQFSYKQAPTAGRFLAGGVSKLANQGYQEGKQVVDTAKMQTALLSKNSKAFSNANKQSQQDYKGFKSSGGILNVGTATNEKQAKKGDLKTGVTKIGGATLGAAVDVLPFAKAGKLAKVGVGISKLIRGGKVAEKTIPSVTKVVAKTVAKQGAIGGSLSGTSSVGSQLLDKGKVSVKQTLKDTGLGVGLGSLAGVAGANKAIKGVAKDLTKTSLFKNAASQKLTSVGRSVEKAQADLKPSKQLLLGAGDGKAKAPKVQGDGFTMSSKADPEAIHMSQRSQVINTQLQRSAIGKSRLAPDAIKALVQEKKDIKAIAAGKKDFAEVYPDKAAQISGERSKSVGAQVGETSLDYPVSRPKATPKAKDEIKLNGDGNFTPKSVGEKLRAAVSSTKAAANPLIRLGNQGHIAAANVAKKVQADFTTKGRQSIADLSAIEAQMKKDGLTEADLPRIREEGANADTQTAKLLHKFLDDYKKDVTANDLVKGVKDNYFPRHAQFEQSILKRARGLSKTSSNTKNRAQLETQDEYGLTHTTDKYQTHAQFEAGVEGYGGKTLSPLASLKQMSQNIDMNVRNAKLLDQLKTTAMGDGNAAVVSGLKKPSGPYVAVEKLPGQFVHKDVAPLLETLSKPESKTGSAAIDAVGDLNSATKRLVTYNAGVHGKNFVIGDMRNRGWKAFVPFTDHYGEEDIKRAVAHGLEPFNAREIQQFDDMVTRHMTGPLGSKIEALRGKADSLLFDRFGNSRGMHTFISVEKELTRMQKYVPGLKDLTSDEISSLAARSAKDTMMMSSPIERSLGNRQISRVVFFAGQFVQNTAQLASKAIGLGTDKTLSKGAQKAEQILAVKRIVRGSSYLFAGAQAMNMATTGHPTWENRGSKVLPVFYVDKSTGKEYHLTNFYGQLGDALGLVTDPKNFVSHKISPGLREVGQMLSNKDALGGDITDKTASGPRQSMQFIFHALGDLVTPAGVGAPDIKAAINKTGPPGATNIGRLLGYGVSAKDQNDTDKLVDKLYQGRFGNAPLDPKQQALISQEAKARQDVKNGNTNSANVQAVKGAMSAAQFTKFIKSGGSGTTQRHFDSLPTEDKLKVINTLGTKDLQAIDVTSAAKSIATNKNAYEALIQKGETDQTIKQTLQKAGYDASKLNDLVRSTKSDSKARARASRGHKSAKWTSPAAQ